MRLDRWLDRASANLEEPAKEAPESAALKAAAEKMTGIIGPHVPRATRSALVRIIHTSLQGIGPEDVPAIVAGLRDISNALVEAFPDAEAVDECPRA